MARFLILFALCVLPALVSASRPVKNPFVVVGKVFCDTCRCGFETSATTYIHGAKVRVECKDRETLKVAYHVDGVTDTTGTYRITVADDHEDELCESVLISSPQTDCTAKTPGRDRSRVILTNNNGIISNIRNANAMGFTKDTALSGCTQLLKQYQEYDE
ncbi:pollen-specific protein C13-like [Macadamia integrifolia]|uniref:pollen-specific protein C13-like n=1 Tax=Macadamia integrifolia TaxID=60698 RepID=UPI001C5019FE|nr:pollen-specific protein C13-like [Macadamia integrifolia]